MSVPSHADVVVLRRRPGPSLLPGDLAAERRPLRAPGPGEVMVRNVVTSVDPYQLRMLRGSSEVTPVVIGEPVPANSAGIVVASEDPDVPVGAQVATYPMQLTFPDWPIWHAQYVEQEQAGRPGQARQGAGT